MKLNELLNEKIYHGSPHKFKTFDISKIGTGEGFQTYGWGLYFTDKIDVANYYKNRSYCYEIIVKLPGNKIKKLNVKNQINLIKKQHGEIIAIEVGKQLNDLIEKYNNDIISLKNEARHMAIKSVEGDLVFRLVRDAIAINNIGCVYESIIPDSYNDKLLVWNKDYNSQSNIIKNAINKYVKENPNSMLNDAIQSFEQQATTGATIYQLLSDELDSDKKASLTLNKLGIVGIKYLDQYSRENKNGTYNYVIFNKQLINIINKNISRIDKGK